MEDESYNDDEELPEKLQQYKSEYLMMLFFLSGSRLSLGLRQYNRLFFLFFYVRCDGLVRARAHTDLHRQKQKQTDRAPHSDTDT